MAVGALTTAAPALLGRRLTEGYLTQPNGFAQGAWRALRLTGTVNLEGLTLQRGELNAGSYGEGYIDRRHPHTLLHEVMLSAATPEGARWRASIHAGKGFTPFGTDDPMMRPFVKYPVNHHHAQIIERVQVGGALHLGGAARHLTVEQTWFNGDEPTGPFAAPQWSRVGDSHATRLTMVPATGWEWQASRAFVRSPGLTQGGAFDHQQASTSLRYEAARQVGLHYALLEAARTNESLDGRRVFHFSSVLGETAIRWRQWTLALRAERTDRPETERLLDLFRTANGHVDFQIVGITQWTVGTVHLEHGTRWGGVRPFIEFGSAHARATMTPAVFVPSEFYGNARQWSLTAGVRLHAGEMRPRMGRYGVLDPSLARDARPSHSAHSPSAHH